MDTHIGLVRMSEHDDIHVIPEMQHIVVQRLFPSTRVQAPAPTREEVPVPGMMSMHETDGAIGEGKPLLLLQVLADSRRIAIPGNSKDLGDGLQLFEHRQIADITRMQDNVYTAQYLEHTGGKFAQSIRNVSVGNDANFHLYHVRRRIETLPEPERQPRHKHRDEHIRLNVPRIRLSIAVRTIADLPQHLREQAQQHNSDACRRMARH